tara:strand:+ start:6829 stop:7305 length:477 start_codon:yes stop_codon:yes gene_type:complete
MFCKLTCGIAIMFIIATIWMNISMRDKSTFETTYLKLLDNHQKDIYNKIKIERANIAMSGYGAGLLLSLLLIVLNYISSRKHSLSTTSMACLTGAVTFSVQYFYYILSPKTDFMVLHLESREQREAWLKIYKQCQYNYHLGLVIGIIGAILLSASFKC